MQDVVTAHAELELSEILLLKEKSPRQSTGFILSDGGPEHSLAFLSRFFQENSRCKKS